MTDTTERVQLLVMRGVIAEMEPADKEKVQAVAERLRDVVKDQGAHGVIALALVSCETASGND